jgi:glyoxylase-like metal-dependent hydrolase (beta-lactamase superfamily II)
VSGDLGILVGSVELVPVPDASGVLCPYAEAYPDVAAGEWEPYRTLYPELFVEDDWRLPCLSYLVRSERVTILVDTGVGPPGLWDWTAEEEGLLPGSLEAVGVGLDEVDVVFLTHLHVDHIGWNTDLDGVPFFPRARYVVHRDALAYVLRRPDRTHIRRCVVPLVDRFEQVSGEVEVAPGVVSFEAPGHSPGHMGLRISSAGQEATFVADVVPHAALLDRPEWVFAFDEDSSANAPTRAALVEELRRRDGLVVCGHYPGSGIGRLHEREGRLVWEEARW